MFFETIELKIVEQKHGQAEWAKQHHVEHVNQCFLNDEFKPLVPLPGPPDQLATPGPTPPALNVLAWGTGKAKETLKTFENLVGWSLLH